MTDREIANYSVTRNFQCRTLIERYLVSQGIEYKVDLYQGPGSNEWLASSWVFNTSQGAFVLSARAHMAKLGGYDPRSTIKYIKDDTCLDAVLTDKNDVLVYLSRLSHEFISELHNICNSALLPEEGAEKKRREEQEEREKAEKEQQESFKKLIDDFTDDINNDPNNAAHYVLRAGSYHQIRMYDQAIEDINMAIKLDPNSADNYAFRGGAYYQKGNEEQAMADLNQAIKMDSNCKKAYALRAAFYSVKGEHDKSIADYEEVVRLDPKDDTYVTLLENAKKIKVNAELEKSSRAKREAKEKTHKKGRMVSAILAALVLIMSLIANIAPRGLSGIGDFLLTAAVFLVPFLVIFLCFGKVKRIIFLCAGVGFSLYLLSTLSGMSDGAGFLFLVALCICHIIACVTAMVFPRKE